MGNPKNLIELDLNEITDEVVYSDKNTLMVINKIVQQVLI